MKPETRGNIKAIIKNAIESKNLSTETEYSPFFNAIFSKEQIITHSIIHSFYTSFGMSVYEQIAVVMANGAGDEAQRQYELLGEIDDVTEQLMSKIHMNLRNNKSKPDSEAELEAIRKSIKKGDKNKDPDRIVDLFIKKRNGQELCFDITSVKPNKKEFIELKRKLLRWLALRLSQDKNADILAAVALPYNPYHPAPYSRWTKENMYDDKQLLVGKDFWDFIGGKDSYEEILEICKEVGKDLEDKIKKFAK